MHEIPTSEPEESKACSKCGVEKKLSAFRLRKKGETRRASRCIECAKADSAEWRRANPARFKAGLRDWYRRNEEEQKANSRARRNADPEAWRAAARRWSEENPGKVSSRTARHRAADLCAMPKWANEFFIEEAYELARRRTEATGYPWEVDHIVPLNHPDVCGLHVEHNLQVIPMVANRAKGNRWTSL